MAHYLITGGGGFVGAALAHELVQRGETVTVFDNFVSGQRENLADIADQLTVVPGDIRNPQALSVALKHVEYILHQAAVIEVARSVLDPLHVHDNNLTGTVNLLVAARDAKVKRVVLASSSAVYGNS